MLGEVGRGVLEVGSDGWARQGGRTPLWAASSKGHLEVVSRLIEAGAGVNQASSVSA